MARSHLLDVYGTRLYLATSKADWKKLAKKYPSALKGWAPEAETAGQVSSFTNHHKHQLAHLVVVIWIDVRQHSDQATMLDTIAHEASHAAGRILEAASHDFGATDEPHAYLVGWLTRWIWQGTNNGDTA